MAASRSTSSAARRRRPPRSPISSPPNGPFQHTRQTQDVASVSFSGSPLLAVGGPGVGRVRRANIAANSTTSSPIPMATASPTRARTAHAYPADPLLSDAGNNWYAGNYHNGTRQLSRATKASSSSTCRCSIRRRLGKRQHERRRPRDALQHVGHRLDVEDRRHLGYAARRPAPARRHVARRARAEPLRAVRRADHDNVPNFTDPFNNRAVNDPPEHGRQPQSEAGNRAQHRGRHRAVAPALAAGLQRVVRLLPDQAERRDLDAVAQQAGQSTAIAGLTATVRRLRSQRSDERRTITSTSSRSTSRRSTPTASTSRRAISSRNPLGAAGPISRSRGLATHVRQLHHATPACPAPSRRQSAGRQLRRRRRDWKLLAVETMTTDRFSLTLQERWFSDGVFGNQYVVCDPGDCPVSTANNPTIDYN